MCVCVCFNWNCGLLTPSILKAPDCASTAFHEEGFSLLPSLCSHNKTVSTKTMQSHASDISSNPSAVPTDFRFSGCHSVTVPFSHTSDRALHSVKTWHWFTGCTLFILYICVSVQMCIQYVIHAWVYVYYPAAHTCGFLHMCHSVTHLLSQSNHILITAVEDITTCSPTGSG